MPERRRLSHATLAQGSLELLDDSIIEEILLRLPLSSVFRSRCVSKQWLSLTTLAYFIGRRELHHAHFLRDPPIVLLLQKIFKFRETDFLCWVPDVKISGFSLDFLPGFCLNDNNPVTVEGSCEDLLLCTRDRLESDYFVVNPITRQWLALPPTLRLLRYVVAGFVCEPASVSRARKGGELRYRVVFIPDRRELKTEFNVQIFSSDNGEWNEYAMRLPAELVNGESFYHAGVACSGILYWQLDYFGGKVVGLDPFNPMKKGIFMIQRPDILGIEDTEAKKHVLGTCRGKLKMSEMLCPGDMHDETLCLNIWELENVEAKWRCVKVLPLVEMLDASPSIACPATDQLFLNVAFHPSNEDIIYLECTNKFIRCNMKTMSVEIVSDYEFNESFCGSSEVFPFELPWWPTPVPQLT